MTSNVQIEEEDGVIRPVILEAAYVTRGKTAQAELDEVCATAFQRGRDALKGWIAVHMALFPDDDIKGLFPDPGEFGLHRLGGGGLVSSDNCNQANKSTPASAAYHPPSLSAHFVGSRRCCAKRSPRRSPRATPCGQRTTPRPRPRRRAPIKDDHTLLRQEYINTSVRTYLFFDTGANLNCLDFDLFLTLLLGRA